MTDSDADYASGVRRTVSHIRLLAGLTLAMAVGSATLDPGMLEVITVLGLLAVFAAVTLKPWEELAA